MHIEGQCPVLWDGEYVKEHYWVYLGSERIMCWPNAGRMISQDGSMRTWCPEDQVHVALVSRRELKEWLNRRR